MLLAESPGRALNGQLGASVYSSGVDWFEKAYGSPKCCSIQIDVEGRTAAARHADRREWEGCQDVLLLSVPDHEFRLLRTHLEPVDLPHHLILNEAGDKIHFAYFLNEGMTSLVVVTHDGQSVEVRLGGPRGHGWNAGGGWTGVGDRFGRSCRSPERDFE